MSSSTPVPSDEYRLPTNVRVEKYAVTIRTDLEKLVFDGFVVIDLEVKEETSTVVLNVASLNLHDGASISSSGALQIGEPTHDNEKQRVSYQFPKALPVGKASLQIAFDGVLDGSMVGYYKSTYQQKDGKPGVYALTQFEPTDARRAFPCWDEPLLKASFEMTMISRANTVNLSNMPATSEKVYDASEGPSDSPLLENILSTLKNSPEQWKVTKFAPTPPMSSYLAAFANGEFEYLESSYTSPLSGKTRPLRIYATPDVIHQAQFALDVKRKVLPLYEQVFDVEYPLPKLDTLVASDFDAGAMENWGLITGRTSAFLLDPNSADMAAKKQVATTQSHEVAHMWFGNVVTMSWWDNLYLNEGFATLMGEVIIIDKIFPEWKVDTEFIGDHLQRALGLDAKLSSHPIEVECPDANHINQIFDSLSYSKAGSVLRMLSNHVGQDLFLKGVSLYLKKNLFGNAVTADLWAGIAEATGTNVPQIMENWVTKMGFPVLTITETSEGIHVRQDRFLETGKAQEKDNETIWTIPLSILSVDTNGKASIDHKVTLDTREATFPVDTSKPYKLNAGTVGVFRVLYTPERLEKIAVEAAKDDSAFTLADRIGLVYDSITLAKAGYASVSSSLALVEKLANEKEYLVWDSLLDNLGTLSMTWWEHPEIVSKIDALRRSLTAPLVKRLGFEYSATDDADTTLLRTRAISTAASAGEPTVVKELQSRFAHMLENGDDSRIPPDLQNITFVTAVKWGGRAEYNEVKRIHENAKTPTGRIAAMAAMGASKDIELAKETCAHIATGVRDQDVMYVFRGLGANPQNRHLLAAYFKDNYDVLYKRFESTFTLANLVKTCFGYFSTQKDHDEMVEFFKTKDTAKYLMAYEQTKDGILARSAWVDSSTKDISQWLGEWEKRTKSN